MSDVDGPTTDTTAVIGTDNTKIDTPTFRVDEGEGGIKFEAKNPNNKRETTIMEDVFRPFGPEEVPVTSGEG